MKQLIYTRMKEVDKVNEQNYYVETVLRQRVNW